MYKSLFTIPLFTIFISSTSLFAQQNATIKGTIIDSETQKPMEYAVVSVYNTTDENQFNSVLTDANGSFSIPIEKGSYDFTVEFTGYETYTTTLSEITDDRYVGIIKLTPSSEWLETIVIDQKRPEVEYRLDKKIYNIAENNMAKGASASEALEQIPSVEVDADGNVSLRGNEAVRIYIDGKNTGVTADLLKMIPSETIDQIEVITNPSSRYSAEGSAGILNIKLKKGTNQGFNGSISTSINQLGGYAINTSANYKTNGTNIYAQLGYNKRVSEGSYSNQSTYYDDTHAVDFSINESSQRNKKRTGISGKVGIDWQLTPSITWDNSISLRTSKGDNPVDLFYNQFDSNNQLTKTKNRQTSEDETKWNGNYQTELRYFFDTNKEHTLSLSGSVGRKTDNEDATITTYLDQIIDGSDQTTAREQEWEKQIQADYTLPIGENQRFEAGYKLDSNHTQTSFDVQQFDGNQYISNPLFLSDLDYNESTHALYSQYAGNYNDINYMFGLRVEHTNTTIYQKISQEEKEKDYTRLFPSLFLSYNLSPTNSLSFNYTKRIWRPRGRMINPVSSYSSSMNYFSGNPDLNPSLTDVIEASYLKRLRFGSLQLQAYYHHTTNSIEYIRRTYGTNNEGIPITIIGPLNISTQHRIGGEINFSYNPYGWWRFNTNFNLYQTLNRGDYTYTNENNQEVHRNFDSDNFAYTLRINNQITLPYDIQWQSALSYKGAQTNAQGTTAPSYYIDSTLSKDLFNNQATLSLSVRDLLDSRKMIKDTQLPTIDSHVEMQWRKRMITLSFNYRFNQSKKEARKNTNFEPEDSNEGML